MKISIQTYWGAEVNSLPKSPFTPLLEERIKEGKAIKICDIIIDSQLRGSVMWNGNNLIIKSSFGKERLCRFCGNMQGYGEEGSMRCIKELSKSDDTAKTCAYYFFFAEKTPKTK